jgi:lipopolysaccharide/colanic/teichoic acid biosynthesis glycosyltransferase
MIMKRLFDLLVSFIALLFLLPLFVLLGIIIRLDSPGPAYFRQERIGRFGKSFKIIKFRTMVVNAESLGYQITSGEDARVTKFGRFLRRYKLDELPQLLNVFLGEMSLVGPRPEVPKYVYLFQDQYNEILTVKPGITDYAAVEFRDEESVLKRYDNPEEGYVKEVLPKKIELYKQYLKIKNFRTDIKLILLTLKKLL